MIKAMLHPNKIFFTTVVAVFFLLSFSFRSSADSGTHSPFKVKIVFKKHVFKIGEKLEGKIVVGHNYPANLPGVFIVKMYHNDQKVNESITSIPAVPMGETDFPLRSFGIRNFNVILSDAGKWQLRISPQNDEARATEATIRVIK